MINQPKNKNLSQKLTGVLVVLLLILGLVIFLTKVVALKDKKTVELVGQEIEVILAQTADQKSLGLGQRDALELNQGMLFVYDQYVIPSFWMKDMRFPIDIIWIKDNVVVGYEKSLKPQDHNNNLPTYQPKVFINYVLEVNEGFVDKYGLLIGDEVKLRI